MLDDSTYTYDTAPIRETTAVEGQVVMPFYLLIDVSGSMRREEAALNAAVNDLVGDIRQNPIVDDLVMLGIITFSDQARVVVPLDSPSKIVVPHLATGGGTQFGAAFTAYRDAFEQDSAALKQSGMKVYRPCVFFLTDGAPNDRRDYLATFRTLFGYDPGAKSGNRTFPYFVPYGFGGAPEDVIKSLAYPDFGPSRGRWFRTSKSDVREVLGAMTMILGNTMVSSGRSASDGMPQIIPPTPEPGSDTQFGEAGVWM